MTQESNNVIEMTIDEDATEIMDYSDFVCSDTDETVEKSHQNLHQKVVSIKSAPKRISWLS